MRALVLLLLAGCATGKVALTTREEPQEAGITPEETAAWERAYEENEAARVEAQPARSAMSAPPRPAPRPAAAPAPARVTSTAPAPAPAREALSVASVVLHTPAGDMEVKCPSVCPPGQACVQPAPPDDGGGGGLPEVGIDLLKEVFTPLAAAIGGAIAGIFINRKGKKNGR